jgi:hypothetical protein
MTRFALLALLVPALAVADPPKAEWKGSVSAGLILLTGNSETTTFTGAAALSRETFGWILSAKAAGAYGRTRPPAGGEASTTALNAGVLLRADRKFGERWTVFAAGGVETDHVASVEYRTAAELGVSALWVEEKQDDWVRLGLRTDLGARYGYEARYAYYGDPTGPQPGQELIAPRLGLAFRYAFSKEVFFTEEAEALANLSGAERYLVKSVSKVSARLNTLLTLGVGYTVAHDTAPAPGKEKTDTALTVLLELAI